METGTDEPLHLLKSYISIKEARLKLGIAEKLSGLLALLIAGVFFFLLFTGALFFLSLLFARLINNWLHSNWPGYLIVAVLYAGSALFAWRYRFRVFQLPILNSLLEIFNEHDENNLR